MSMFYYIADWNDTHATRLLDDFFSRLDFAEVVRFDATRTLPFPEGGAQWRRTAAVVTASYGEATPQWCAKAAKVIRVDNFSPENLPRLIERREDALRDGHSEWYQRCVNTAGIHGV